MDRLHAVEIAPRGQFRRRLSGGLSAQDATDARLIVVIPATGTLQMQILT
jgi:hypothetical protein